MPSEFLETLTSGGVNVRRNHERPPCSGVLQTLKECRNQIIATAVVTLGSFGTGTVFGWSAVANDSIEKTSDFGDVSRDMISWVTSLAILGAFLGGPLAGLTMDYLGRRSAILIFSLPFLFGWIIMYSAYFLRPDGFFLLYIGRLVTGICAGSYLVIIPTYIKEISSDSMRGILGSAMPLMLVTGILYTFVIGTFCNWNVLSAFCGVTPLFLALGTFIVPETPRFLMVKKDVAKAVASYKWLARIESQVDAQEKVLSLFSAETNKQTTNSNARKGALLTRPVAMPIIIIVFVIFFQQFGGVNAVTLYTIEIFQLAGDFIQPHTATIILGVEQVVFVLVSMFVVDIVGRKTLLVSCNILMGVSLVGLGVYFYLKEKGDGSERTIAWLPVVTIYAYMAAYSAGVGSVPWVLASEIYNPDYRAESSTIMTSSYWIFGFIVAKIYNDLKSALNVSGSFWFYGAFCIGGAIFAAIFVPETKGKTSEEIVKYFSNEARSFKTGSAVNNNYSENCDTQKDITVRMNGQCQYDESDETNIQGTDFISNNSINV